MSILRTLIPGFIRRSSSATIHKLKPGAVFQVRSYPDAYLQVHQEMSRPKGFLGRLAQWLFGKTRDVMTAVHLIPPYPEMAAQGFWYTPVQRVKDWPVFRAVKDGLHSLARQAGYKRKFSDDALIFSQMTSPLQLPFFYRIKERLFGGVHLVDGLGKKHKIRLVG